ncbi:MAG: hypothetical protein IJ400_05185 [Clostridia bacterium]|nr:hypothetical protein [Clostridia bacterium]
MRVKKQTIILIIALVLLVVGIVLAVGLPKWLGTGQEGGTEEEIPIPSEGESLYYNALLMYPRVSSKDITSLTLKNETGEFTFVQKWSKEDNNYKLRLKGFENIPCDESLITILTSYIGTSITHEPMRDVTEEQLRTYGLDSSCKLGYTLVYEDEDGTKRQVNVRIGDKANTSSPIYYAYVEGRNNIYMLQSGATGMSSFDEALLSSKLDFIAPTIFKGFSNSTYALMGTNSFNIYKTTLEDANGDGNTELESLVRVALKSRDEANDSSTFEIILERGTTEGSKIALANNEYLTKIFETILIEFQGDSVVEIYTEETDLSKYGLEVGQKHYFISAVFEEKDEDGNNRTVSFDIGSEINGYHYTIARFYDYDTGLIVKIPKDSLFFINENDEYLLENYAATNTVLTGFYEYLHKDEEAGEPGMKEITINTKDYQETFYTSYDVLKSKLSVTTKTSGLSFIDVESEDPYDRNQFSNLYTLLIFYPMPRRINTMTEAEKQAIMVEKNMVYELIAQRNDGKLLRYTYYKINASYALAEYCEGKVENGTEVWGEASVIFDTTMGHIEKITDNYKIIMEGGKIRPDNIIY